MKKFSIVLVIVLLLTTMCACGLPSNRFMSGSQVSSVENDFPDLHADVTLNYTVSSQKVEVKIHYKLLLDKAPLATIAFLQLANDDFYDDTVLDYYTDTYKYAVFGRYLYKNSALQENDKKYYYKNPSDLTFKGEFKSNGYPEPNGGYAQFKIMSLAMYHDDWAEDNNTFDSANGYIVMATANKTLNSDNYAVFAEMESISVRRSENSAVQEYTKVPSDILTNLTGFTSRTSRTVYDDDTETNSTSISIMSTVVTVKVEILGDYDWSKLPKIG